MHFTHCMGPIRIPPNGQRMFERRGIVLPSQENTRCQNQMPGFRLMLKDDKGEYPHLGRTLIFEGSMLVMEWCH